MMQADTINTPTGILPLDIVQGAMRQVFAAGRYVVHMSYNGIKSLPDTCWTCAKKTIALAGKAFEETDTIRSISYMTIGCINSFERVGYSVQAYANLRETLTCYNDVISLTKLVSRVDSFFEGKALKTVARGCSKVSYIVYDVLGLVNMSEKLALVSKGVGNTITTKAFGVNLDKARPFFGFLAYAFSAIDVFQIAYHKSEKSTGFDLCTCLDLGASIGRMVSLALGKTLPGALFQVASGFCALLKFVNETEKKLSETKESNS